MLKKLRDKKVAKKIWIGLAIIILPPFILWGLGPAMRSRKERNASSLEFQDALGAVRIAAMMRFGDNFTEIQKYLNLEEQARERILLLAEAKKHKISSSDQEVVQFLESYALFQRKGKFDYKTYRKMLEYFFHTQPRVFEEQARQNLILNKLYRRVTRQIEATEEEIKEDYRQSSEEISVSYLAALHADFAKEIKPNEEEINGYYLKNSSQFKEPGSFNVEYAAGGSEEKIKEVMLRLNKESDFKKAAEESGLTFKETGLFKEADPLPGIGWSPEVSEIISKLEINKYSEPLKIESNYYLFKLKEKKEPSIPELEKIKDKVKEAVIKERAQNLAKAKIEECLKALKETYQRKPKAIDFKKIAQRYGLKTEVTKPFKFASYIEGIGASDLFWQEAQKLKEDEISQILSNPLGLYIIRLKSKTAFDEKKFASEKEEFRNKILSRKKEEFFAKFLEDLKRKAR